MSIAVKVGTFSTLSQSMAKIMKEATGADFIT